MNKTERERIFSELTDICHIIENDNRNNAIVISTLINADEQKHSSDFITVFIGKQSRIIDACEPINEKQLSILTQ